MVANFVSQGSTTPLTMQGNGWPCSFPGIPRDPLDGACFTESSEWRRGPCEAGSSSVTEATRCGPRMMRMMSTQCWMDRVYNLHISPWLKHSGSSPVGESWEHHAKSMSGLTKSTKKESKSNWCAQIPLFLTYISWDVNKLGCNRS